MLTQFRPDLLADPAMAVSESVIRKCVHCGFCTATCPTYVLLGDELDSPRGRIYLMKEMLENEREPTAEVVKHIDRCLSCLACMTTCPSDVNYMHLVDHARAYIQERYKRPLMERLFRDLLAGVLPHPKRFRVALALARLARPLRRPIDRLVEGAPSLKPLAAMLAMAPARGARTATAHDARVSNPKGRIALLQGCAEPVLKPEIREATVRLLNRAGYDVIFASGEVCCGALVHHMGREAEALESARRNVDAWSRLAADGLDAVVITASGCGTTIKDYGFMLRDDPAYAEKAAAVSALAMDVSELLARIDLPPVLNPQGLVVAYHAACSLQHGQRVVDAPKALLAAAGFTVRTPVDAHLCCGSAGTYNILQPQIAGQLGDRKAETLAQLKPDVVAAGNIGCAMQLGQRLDAPVAHTVELLDWATGGPVPPSLAQRLTSGASHVAHHA
jgi:glycolate oxidase iron-sulfur subunit